MTVKAMAQAIGVPETTYREWEYGRAIKGEPYVRIANELGASLTELFTGKKPSKLKALDKLDLIAKALQELRLELLSFL